MASARDMEKADLVKVATRAQKARVRVGLAVKALALVAKEDLVWEKALAKALETPCKEATEKVSTTWAAMVANAVLTAKDSERVKEATMIGEVRRETLSSFPNVACDQLIFL